MAQIFALSEADHARVSEAVGEAERGTAGEIVTIVADASDRYLDVALWWPVSVAVMMIAALAAFPAFHEAALNILTGGWVVETSASEALTLALGVFVLTFVAMRLIMMWRPLLLALTPRAVQVDRVHKRAVRYFKVGAQHRTLARTGILIYLSMAEHRAEIVADEAVHARVAPEAWGEAMAKLVAGAREGQVAEGMVAAIGDVGAILAAHFPRDTEDRNELPDRLIEL